MRYLKQNRKLMSSGVLLALASSLCCIMPILVILGATGSAVSMFIWIAPFRPYLLLATAIVLGIAFYRAYRPEAKDGCGCTEKKTGMQSKGFLWTVTLLSVGLATFPYYADHFYKNTSVGTSVSSGRYIRQVLRIKGMSCASCEGHVNHALQRKKGVQQVSTSYSKGETIVKFDSSLVSLLQLAATIEKETGYTVIHTKKDVN